MLKKFKLANIVYLAAVLIPVILVFRSLFLGSPVWGDAPHFSNGEFAEILAEPYAWVTRGANFGGINKLLWITPIMYLFTALHTWFNAGSDVLIKAVFYVPSIALSAAGSFFFAKYLKLSMRGILFAVLVYVLNTYYLLLIDGGVVGVALAYGIFPFSTLFLKKFIDKPSLNGFYLSLSILFASSIADPRIAVLSILLVFLMGLIEKNRNIKFLILSLGGFAGLTSYWWVPLLRLNGIPENFGATGLKGPSFLNGVTLFAPHYPGNIFGRLNEIPWYFYILPIILVFSASNYLVLFLFFSLLIGGIYLPLTKLFPLGVAFRDATKFFIPLALTAGILAGKAVERIKNKFFAVAFYVFLIILIFPALFGKMNFVLSQREHSREYEKISGELSQEEGFFRTLWFPERHPLAFETTEKPALDAKDLADLRPFADMIVGTFDRFNFLHNKSFLEWFSTLGIKYLIFSGDQRNPYPNEEEQENWSDLLARVSTQSGITREDFDTPIYKIEGETRPNMFAVEKLYLVVGEPLDDKPLPAIYFEDGKLDPSDLEGIASQSASVVFNKKDETDLAMSFLQKYFMDSQKSEWANYASSDYLMSKFQLLIRGHNIHEFDYGKGIHFSDQEGEELVFELEAPKDGLYVLALRLQGDALKGYFNKESFDITTKRGNFEWYTKYVNLKKGKHKLVLDSTESGLNVVNTVGLIPDQEYKRAIGSADTFVKHFSTTDSESAADPGWYSFEFNKVSPVRYGITAPEKGYWIVFTDSFDPLWKLRQGTVEHNSLPVYSMVNGFFIEPGWTKVEIIFKGQEQVRWGIYYTALSLLVLGAIYFWGLSLRDEEKEK